MGKRIDAKAEKSALTTISAIISVSSQNGGYVKWTLSGGMS